MLSFMGSIVPSVFVDIIKYILKSFINGGRREENVWFIISTRVLRASLIYFNHLSYVRPPYILRQLRKLFAILFCNSKYFIYSFFQI